MGKLVLFFKIYDVWIKISIVYIFTINLIAFILMGVDKKRARTFQWRIPEKYLFASAILGGTVGGIAGMNFFHHKTLHRRFVWGLPIILIVQIGLMVYVFIKIKPVYML